MSETDITTRAKYYDYVKTTVNSIENEYNDYPDSELTDLVFESIDSANIILYYSYNMDILQNSDNEPQEWKHLVDESDGYRKVINAMAFDVFRQDVWDEINSRDSIDY